MAVEARHLSLFPPQLRSNREMMNILEANGNIYGTPIGFGVPPLSGTTTETLPPMYGSVITDLVAAKTPMKSDSGLTNTLPVSRKRSRDTINPMLSFPNGQNPNDNNRCSAFSFFGEDISLQIQQQQLDIDRFIAQHTEKVRLEIEERRKTYSNRIIAAMAEGMKKRLRAKEEEIEKIGKLNWALEEKVKSLCLENQIWRDLAQTNEATANVLRSNLEQVLAQVEDEQRLRNNGGLDEAAALVDDAQSCFGSNFCCVDDDDDDDKRMLMQSGGERKLLKGKTKNDDCTGTNNCNGKRSNNNNNGNRWCRSCGKEESCVLLLPCRHLCLCSVCGSSVHTCPICKSVKNASLHVKISS
ncbi:unnamed protein product [Ilex paraguariensis]|uniref:RING-type domain-containing protein n=1 Tax=Ilex paraguariensis TaxID=185542 RepID=A0ABC8U1I9_9AQUA